MFESIMQPTHDGLVEEALVCRAVFLAWPRALMVLMMLMMRSPDAFEAANQTLLSCRGGDTLFSVCPSP